VHVPEGYSETEVTDIVNAVLAGLSQQFRFGYFEVEDLKQQGWLFALEVLPKFDVSRNYSLNNFLYGHLRRQFINFKRNNFSRTDSPCLSCPFYDPELRQSFNQCAAFADRDECDKFREFRARNERKRVLCEGTPSSEDGTFYDVAEDSPFLDDSLSSSEVVQLIDLHLPIEFRADWRRFVDGVRLPSPRRSALMNVIRSIIGDNYGA
jgi:DNA-directed RNA polymerase specialized sigma24 family protein